MSNPAPICTHIKSNGIRCGSPAASETDFCHHHSAVKTALAKARPQTTKGEFAPIPFVFPEDRASMQINYFLLLQAFNEGHIDLKHFKAMMSLLKSMAANLGKSGSLVDQNSDQSSAVSDQKNGAQESGRVAQEDKQQAGAANRAPIEFSPEMMTKFEEIERLDPTDPSYADRIRSAVAEGLEELKAQGLDLMEMSPVAASSTR